MKITNIHVVSEGESIQSIASIYNIDWVKIVEINGLEYPYVVGDIDKALTNTNSSVATVGSKLIVPEHYMDLHNNTRSTEEIEEGLFGVDLSLSQPDIINVGYKGEFQEKDGSVRTVSGVENLKQQLLTRLSVKKGTLWKHQEFGSELEKYIGRKVTKELLIEVSLEVKRCLLQDFRVKSVEDIKIKFHSGGIFVSCYITPINSEEPFLFKYFGRGEEQ